MVREARALRVVRGQLCQKGQAKELSADAQVYYEAESGYGD